MRRRRRAAGAAAQTHRFQRSLHDEAGADSVVSRIVQLVAQRRRADKVRKVAERQVFRIGRTHRRRGIIVAGTDPRVHAGRVAGIDTEAPGGIDCGTKPVVVTVARAHRMRREPRIGLCEGPQLQEHNGRRGNGKEAANCARCGGQHCGDEARRPARIERHRVRDGRTAAREYRASALTARQRRPAQPSAQLPRTGMRPPDDDDEDR